MRPTCDPERLAAARELGALVDCEPVSAAIVTAAAGLDDALARLDPGGLVVVFAAPAEPVPVPLDRLYRNELAVVGSRSASPETFEAAVGLLPTLSLPPVTLLPLERFDEGVELYRNGEVLKVAFTP